MSHLDNNLSVLKEDLVRMWNLVSTQMEKARLALIQHDRELAQEVRANEKMVDAFELKIDMDCESIIMLQNPVAIDLRFLLSVLKINYNLEGIGDYANSIAKTIEAGDKEWPKNYIEATHIPEMFFHAQAMIQQSLSAFENSDRKQTKGLFSLDQKLDAINTECPVIIRNLITENPQDIAILLDAFSIIRKLERAGDHIKNIAEELIFYFDAVVVKHSKLKKTGGNQ